MTTNTVGKQLKNLKIFLRDCARKNITEPIDTSDFKVYQEEVENIYLPEGIHMNLFNKLIKVIAKKAGISDEIKVTQKRGGERIDKTLL